MKRSPPPGTPLWLRLTATFALIGEAAPFAPATFASFALLPFIFYFAQWPVAAQLILTVVLIWVGILISNRAERFYGHDAGAIVIDEVAGMLVTFLMIPPALFQSHALTLMLAGFFFFRVFDVLKPFPAGRAQNLPAGTGIMLDDVAAGVYANLALRLTAGWL